MKKTLKYLAIRITILLICLSIMFLTWYLNNDPHKHCSLEIDKHRHTDTGLGLFIVGFIVIVNWFIVLFVEGIIYFIKGKNNLGWISLAIILYIEYFYFSIYLKVIHEKF